MNSNKYKFSVIIPTYNRSLALDRCLRSLADQTFTDFEVLVCDDGSADDTKQIVEKYRGLLNLKYFYAENWGGPARPRNIGIANANADWICFLDSDDTYSLNRLEFLAAENLEEIDLIYHDLHVVKNGLPGGRIKSRQLSLTDPYHDLLYNLNAIPTSSTCVRSSFLKKARGFEESRDIIGLEDFDLWIRLGKLGVRARYIPVILGSYFIGDNNITFADERQIKRFGALYTKYIDVSKNKGEQNRIRAALAYQIGNISIKDGVVTKGYSFLIRSLINGTVPIKTRSVYYMIIGLKYIFKKKTVKNE